MYYYILHYKKYKGSLRATVISFFSGLLKFTAAAFIIGFIFIAIQHSQKNIRDLIIAGVITVISLTLGKFLEKLADKIGKTDFERKIRENLKFAITMAKENPESKSLYMELNPKYADYLLSAGEAVRSEDGTIITNSPL
ncbi:hypothetical protein [Clostridium saccharoperbutylacetonicum]|uniref:hypothetical protein n=1 Tax=Clostridium saccharoperbutylacetonicum TaxID=36745 RepID=UPI000983D8C6|nr:hypothetical protein [Clostridium saccharoperbutylacetonicum]AQR93378.1 hypothetical protein CLSAP_06760 [Clostridium saccharoperbutylacetonicum]NSB29075.1 hypothetical protein [Clostridium saccharoperbutylacetonicum]